MWLFLDLVGGALLKFLTLPLSAPPLSSVICVMTPVSLESSVPRAQSMSVPADQGAFCLAPTEPQTRYMKCAKKSRFSPFRRNLRRRKGFLVGLLEEEEAEKSGRTTPLFGKKVAGSASAAWESPPPIGLRSVRPFGSVRRANPR